MEFASAITDDPASTSDESEMALIDALDLPWCVRAALDAELLDHLRPHQGAACAPPLCCVL
jgi:hypothetical protein